MSWWRRRRQPRGGGVAKVLTEWEHAEALSNGGGTGDVIRRFGRLCDATVALMGDERPDYGSAARAGREHGLRLSGEPPTTPEQARLAAEAATALLPVRPPHGMRLALESHVAFSWLSDGQGVEMRYQFQDFGVAWARALIACSRAWRQAPDCDRLSLHFARWGANVTGHLTPFAVGDAEVKSVVKESLEQARELEAAVGSADSAAQLTNILRRYH